MCVGGGGSSIVEDGKILSEATQRFENFCVPGTSENQVEDWSPTGIEGADKERSSAIPRGSLPMVLHLRF